MSGNPSPGKGMWANKNVWGGPLAHFSKDPPTGFYRDGFCRVGAEDKGNHSIAATVTQEFLDFTASRGNSLKDVGLKPGMKWCLCANRWKEAMQAAKNASDPIVPKVSLHATSDAALKEIDFKELKKYAEESQTSGAVGGTSPRGTADHNVKESDRTGGVVKSAHPDVGEHPDEAPFNKSKDEHEGKA